MSSSSPAPVSLFPGRKSSFRWLFFALLGLLVALLLARLLFFLPGGALSFPDEDRYLESIKASNLLLAGQVEQACLHLANTQGRPADALLRLPVAMLQVLWHQAGGPPPESPASLRLPQLMNYLVLLANVVLLYQLARRWLNEVPALVAVLIYSALVSTNLYLGHLLPYDIALLVLLLGVVRLTHIRCHRSALQLGVETGLLSMLTVAIYPGYYFAPLLLGALLLTRLPRQQRLQAILSAGVGVLAVLLPLELLTRYGHISFLRTLQELSSTILQGDFDEGFSFVVKYLWEVEGLAGATLLLMALPGAWLLVRSPKTDAIAVLRVLGLVPIALWLLHAVLVYFAHSFVFYGRLIHFFIPFLVLYAVTALTALPLPARRLGLTVLLCVSLWGFGRYLLLHQKLAYPRDVLTKVGVQPTDQLNYYNESNVGHSLDFKLPPTPARPIAAAASLHLINFSFLYPLPTASCDSLPAPDGAQLLYEGPHFLSFLPYGFEGFTPQERAHLRSCGFRCRLYRAR